MRRIYFAKYITLTNRSGAGNLTYFAETLFTGKIASGEKIHTIRKNTVLKVGDLFQPSAWSGRPRFSKAINIHDPLKVVYVADVKIAAGHVWITWNGKEVVPKRELVAKNDGLKVEDFFNWFPADFTGKMIGWTQFPY